MTQKCVHQRKNWIFPTLFAFKKVFSIFRIWKKTKLLLRKNYSLEENIICYYIVSFHISFSFVVSTVISHSMIDYSTLSTLPSTFFLLFTHFEVHLISNSWLSMSNQVLTKEQKNFVSKHWWVSGKTLHAVNTAFKHEFPVAAIAARQIIYRLSNKFDETIRVFNYFRILSILFGKVSLFS